MVVVHKNSKQTEKTEADSSRPVRSDMQRRWARCRRVVDE